MNRRTYTLVLMWLLPLLLARALIPSGYMLGAGSDGFGLIFCSGTMTVPATGHQHPDHTAHADHQASTHAAHEGHGDHSGDHANHGSHDGSESASCPFAIGACAASIDIPHLASVAPAPIAETIAPVVITGSSIASLRAHPIRGPPQLS